MPLIAFANSKPYDLIDNRPYSGLTLLHSSGAPRSPTYRCLVDSGSDYIVLPISAAASVGIRLSRMRKTLHGVTGSASFFFEPALLVDVEGYRITADVLFDPSPSAAFVPLLGRAAMLAAFDVGFTVVEWLWT